MRIEILGGLDKSILVPEVGILVLSSFITWWNKGQFCSNSLKVAGDVGRSGWTVLKGEWKGKRDLTACLESARNHCCCWLHQAWKRAVPRLGPKDTATWTVRDGQSGFNQVSGLPKVASARVYNPHPQGPQTIGSVEDEERSFPQCTLGWQWVESHPRGLRVPLRSSLDQRPLIALSL